MTSFATFDEFFPYYVSEHSRSSTRWVHFGGTHLGAAVGLTGIARRRPALLAAAPAISYGAAWISHFAIEKNRPATFSHPFWSFRGDLRMLGMMWRGRDGELSRLAAAVLAHRQLDQRSVTATAETERANQAAAPAAAQTGPEPAVRR